MTFEDALAIAAPRVAARHAAARTAHVAEAARYRGVRPEGWGPGPWREPPPAEVEAETARAAQTLVAWRDTPTHRLLDACSLMSGALDAARALISRAGVPERLAPAHREQAVKLALIIKDALAHAEAALEEMGVG